MVPAEKATRKNRIEWSVFSLNERANTPLKEKRLMMRVAKIMVIWVETISVDNI